MSVVVVPVDKPWLCFVICFSNNISLEARWHRRSHNWWLDSRLQKIILIFFKTITQVVNQKPWIFVMIFLSSPYNISIWSKSSIFMRPCFTKVFLEIVLKEIDNGSKEISCFNLVCIIFFFFAFTIQTRGRAVSVLWSPCHYHTTPESVTINK